MNSALHTPFLAAINHLLADEAWARAKLQAHAGKVVKLDLSSFAIVLQAATDGLFQVAPAGVEPDVSLSIVLSDLPRLLQDKSRAMSYVKISGDAELASVLAQLSEGLRWEPEADLAPWIGDVAATQVVKGVRRGVKELQNLHQSLSANLAEYLVEEQPVLVGAPALENFRVGVTTLRDDVERIMKRIEKLESKRG